MIQEIGLGCSSWIDRVDINFLSKVEMIFESTRERIREIIFEDERANTNEPQATTPIYPDSSLESLIRRTVASKGELPTK